MSAQPSNESTPTEQIQGCVRLNGPDLSYIPLNVRTPGSAMTADVIGDGTAPTLGAGVATFEDVAFDWVHPCDEAVYVISGELHVSSSDSFVIGRPGDILFMSQHAHLRYETTGVCKVFAAMNLSPDHTQVFSG